MFEKCKRLLAAVLAAGVLTGAAAAADPVPAKADTHWEWCGWGGGGYFWSTAATNDPQVFYLGGDVAGLYKTTDGGKNWKMVNRGLNNYGVYTLAVDPKNDKTLYALTDNGLHRSDDGAATWRCLPKTDGRNLQIVCRRGISVHAVAIDAADSKHLYAGTPKGVLYHSTDGGETWQDLDYAAAGGSAPAASGKGSLIINMNAPSASWSHYGRIEMVYGDNAQDWSKFPVLTAQLRAAEGAPKLEGQLVVQSGEKWTWQQGEWTVLTPGKFVPVRLDLSKLTDMNAVHAVYVIIRSTEAAFKGEIYCDAVTLGEGANAKVIADWENKGNAEGWKAHNQQANYRLAGKAEQSARPAGAPIATVAADPVAGNTLYVATLGKGVYKTADAGKTWKKLALPNTGKAVAACAADNKIVYAAMNDAGLYKSTDGGATWALTGMKLPAKHRVVDVAVAKKNADKVYCLLSDGGWGGQAAVSNDGGATWKIAGSLVRDLKGNPTVPGEVSNGKHAISAVTNISICDAEGKSAIVSANWYNFMTADGGETWVESSRGADITCTTDIRFLNGKVYATAMDEGLLVTADGGANWTQLHPLQWSDKLSGHSWRVNVSGAAGQECILATRSPWNSQHPNLIMRSTDGGKTFAPVYDGLPNYRSTKNCMWGLSYARALAANPQDPKIVYLGIDGDPDKGHNGGGVFKSTDGGATWAQLASQPASRRMYYGLAVDPTDGNRIYWGATSQNGGVHMSEDGGATWKPVFTKDDWIFNVECTADGTVYACGKGLYRSTDHGATWQTITPDFGGTVVVGFASHPKRPGTLWISTLVWSGDAVGAIYETVDGGKTWTDITGDSPVCRPQILRFNPETSELWSGGVTINKLKIK